MRVLLAHPPLTPAGEVSPPLGLCTLASWLRTHGHTVCVLDLDLEVRSCDQPATAYVDVFATAMRSFAPEAVGVTSMYSNSLQAEHLLRTAKSVDPAAITVAGGSHFGAMGTQSLRRIPQLDYVIEGESEPAFAALLAGVPSAEIPRLHYRVDGAVRANPSRGLMDLSDLPPVWSTLGDSLTLDRYAATIPKSSRRRIVYIEAGRGCPFKCSFCATAPFWENRFRVKPVSRLVEEIRFLYEELAYDSFILVHDLLTISRPFMSDFCDAMLSARLPVEWMANSRIDSNLKGLLPKMKAAGCWKLFHGVESAAARVQKTIGKPLSADQVYGCIEELNAHGIGATTSFVIGFPAETESELSSTIEMGARLKLMGVETVQFHRLRHFPPSPISRMVNEAEFDFDSLRIEYPFVDVDEDDVKGIRVDPEFFSGYWLAASLAGTPAKLAHVEMFFHHMVALAPLTVAAAATVAGDRLITTFYEALETTGPPSRERLDWETGNLWRNWSELEPLLSGWIERVTETGGWRQTLLYGLKAYEGHRIGFVTAGVVEQAVASGRTWAAFLCPIHLSTAYDRLRQRASLDELLIRETIVVLCRERAGYAAYLLDSSRLPELVAGDTALAGFFSAN